MTSTFKNLAKTSTDEIHQKETAGVGNKVVAMSSTSAPALDPRPSRDDRRIIEDTLDKVHDGEKYTKDWSDEKVAKDLGIRRSWVSKIREEFYGPDVNEQTLLVADADRLLIETKAEHAAMVKQTEQLMVRIIALEVAVAKLKGR